MKPYKVVNLQLSIRDLFIIDHALRSHILRPDATAEENKQENELLDLINDGIRRIRREGRNDHGTKKDLSSRNERPGYFNNESRQKRVIRADGHKRRVWHYGS